VRHEGRTKKVAGQTRGGHAYDNQERGPTGNKAQTLGPSTLMMGVEGREEHI